MTKIVYGDSPATDNKTDGSTEKGIWHKNHIKNLLFGYLHINSFREFLEPLISFW